MFSQGYLVRSLAASHGYRRKSVKGKHSTMTKTTHGSSLVCTGGRTVRKKVKEGLGFWQVGVESGKGMLDREAVVDFA
jgi:hypothetical protein